MIQEGVRSSLSAYLLAALVTAAAVGLRALLDPWLGNELALVTLYASLAVAVWVGGLGPALLATAAGYLACNYWFIPPRGALHLDAPELIGLLAYLFSCGVIIGFGEALRRARRKADEGQELLRITLASIGDGVIATDTAGRVTYLNGAAEALTGWSPREVAGRPLEEVFRIVHEHTREPVDNPALRALREGVVVALANHTLLIRKDGSELPIDDSGAPIRDEQGRVTGCVLVFRDVSERRQREKERADQLRDARLLAAIVESSNDAIVSKSPEGIIQSWNAAAERLFGYTAEQAVGHPIMLIVPPELADEEAQIMANLRAGRRIDHFETVRTRSDGRPVYVSLTISPIFDEQGRWLGASKIARDITERKDAEKRIRDLLAELREADRRKDEFLATLAHELRGPLAPVRNSLEIAKRAAGDPGLVQQALGTIDRQTAQMERLIDDLLDVSRIAHGRLELRRQRVALGTVISQALEACRPLAERLAHQLNVELPAEPLQLDADPSRLVQVFTNLLTNACRYTEPGGRISLRATRQDHQALISVNDTGMGIAADMLDRIFDTFVQVDQGHERSRAGLGIGLTLVKQVVELHGGRVEAHSAGPGQGSEFRVYLPLAREAAAAALPAPPAARTASGHRILVVDDNRDSATSLAMLLDMAGQETRIAHDGLEALEVGAQFRPDVVLLDLGLPGMSGFDAGRLMRKQPWGANLVLIAVTGWAQAEDRRKSREAGFDHHVVKPVDYDALLALVASLPPTPPA
jgi:PAS domain S-box-containing protein